ncbi:MAG TPA: transcription-repair coupling factor, partial [Nitrospirae bacterium]|nr:transcription-repair coupling factor [Nitrospirota bacterium]
YMGAGFRLAMKDLEIRGAGNMLGPEQSGSIEAVGFDLYMEMLEEAVAELKGEPASKELKPSLNLRVSAYVPEEYISDMALRLSAYRAVSAAEDEDAIKAVAEEMADRYGPVPEPLRNLMDVRGISILAGRLMVTEITDRGARLALSFAEEAGMGSDRVMEAMGKVPGMISDKTDALRFHPSGFEFRYKGEVIGAIRGVLESLMLASTGCK